MTFEHLQIPFVEAGMFDKEAKIFPTLKGIIGTCERWVFSSRDVGIPMAMKRHCKDQFQQLAHMQLEFGQVSVADMH